MAPRVRALRTGTRRACAAGGQNGRLLADTLRVVSERLVERRQLADAPIDQVRAVGVVAWVDVGLGGDEELGRRVGIRPEDGLTTHDDDLVVLGDRRGGADDVLELGAGHATLLRMRQRSRGSSAPAKGLT